MAMLNNNQMVEAVHGLFKTPGPGQIRSVKHVSSRIVRTRMTCCNFEVIEGLYFFLRF